MVDESYHVSKTDDEDYLDKKPVLAKLDRSACSCFDDVFTPKTIASSHNSSAESILFSSSYVLKQI